MSRPSEQDGEQLQVRVEPADVTSQPNRGSDELWRLSRPRMSPPKCSFP